MAAFEFPPNPVVDQTVEGSRGEVYVWDGEKWTWYPLGGGGGGEPGGPDGAIQFNDGGSFAGSGDLTWDSADNVLEVGGDINLIGDNPQILINGVPFEPGGQPAGSTGMIQYNNFGAFGADGNLFWDVADARLGVHLSVLPQYTVDVGGDVNSTGCYRIGGVSFACGDAGGGIDLTNITNLSVTNINGQPAASLGPAGANTQVQWNNNGAFGASANLVWNNSSSQLGIGTASGNQLLLDSYQFVWLNNGGVRWMWAMQGPESGSNSGSDLVLDRFFDAGGAAGVLRITRSTGFVSINGPVTPAYPLDVNGDVNSAGCYRIATVPFACGDGAGGVNLTNITTINGQSPGGGGTPAPPVGSVQWNNNGAFGGSANLYWDAVNSRLGVGTSAPATPLHVHSPVGALVLNVTSASGPCDAAIQGTTDYNCLHMVSDSSHYVITAPGSGIGGLAGSFVINDGLHGATRFVITAAGNVGIGTAAPANLLEVVGTASAANWVLNNQDPAGAGSIGYYYGSPNGASIGIYGASSSGAGALAVTTAGAERFRILSNGFVGINTTTPATILDVNGTIRSIAQIVPTSGQGVEILFSDAAGFVVSFDRSLSAYRNLYIDGAALFLNSGGDYRPVAIGQTSPSTVFDVLVPSQDYGVTASGAGGFRISTGYGGGTVSLIMGAHNWDYAWIQSVWPGSRVLNLALQPLGGNVGINNSNPTTALVVSRDANIPGNGLPALLVNGSYGGGVGILDGPGGNWQGTLWMTGTQFHIGVAPYGQGVTEAFRVQNDANVLIPNGGLAVGNQTAPINQAGDICIARNANPATGAIFFGNSGGRYILWDGASWNITGTVFMGDLGCASANVSGNVAVSGTTNLSGWLGVGGVAAIPDPVTITSIGSIGQLRLAYGSYGCGFRNDGATLWLMITNPGDPWGGFNSLRPFVVDLASGNVNMTAVTVYSLTATYVNSTYVNVADSGLQVANTLNTMNASVGIGGVWPTQKLTVNGHINLVGGGCIIFNDGTMQCTAAAGGSVEVWILYTGEEYIGTRPRLMFVGGTSTYPQANDDPANNRVVISINYSSDARVKRDVRPLEGGLAVINQLHPIEAEYNGLGQTKAGLRVATVSAQEVQSVFPLAVYKNPVVKKLDPADSEETDVLCLDPHAITFQCVLGIQELDRRLSAVEAELRERRN